MNNKMKSALVLLALVGSILALPGPDLRREVLSAPGRIVGGTEVMPKHSLPYQISLQLRGNHRCGGSIYSQDYIITACHCVDGLSTNGLKIIAGGHDLNYNEGTEQTRDISRIIMHPGYSPDTLQNDIALLRVSSPLTLNEYVGNVTLPENNPPVSAPTVVSGWGTTKQDGYLSAKLLEVEVPVVSHADCSDGKVYGSSIIKDMMICCGYTSGGKDSCQGDSGGPLVLYETKILVGIVSWGYGCALAGYPGVYTSVWFFRSWIIANAV